MRQENCLTVNPADIRTPQPAPTRRAFLCPRPAMLIYIYTFIRLTFARTVLYYLRFVCKRNRAFSHGGTITPAKIGTTPRAYQRGFFIIGRCPQREAGLIPRRGVTAPTAGGFFTPGERTGRKMNRTATRPRLIGEVLREIFATKRTRKSRRQRSKGGEK